MVSVSAGALHLFCVFYSSLLSGILPSVESNIAIQRVESNWAVTINTATSNGTLKNIPATPHIKPQNTKFIKIASVERFNVLPVSFGSMIFPNTICNPISPNASNTSSF